MPHLPPLRETPLVRGALPLVGAMIGVWTACAKPPDVVIGYAFPRWGDEVVRVARDEIADRQAGLHPVIRIVYDSAATGDPPDVEVERAERFATLPGLVAVVGHGGSRGSLLAAPVYNEHRIPQIAPTSTSRVLRHAGPWTFQLPPDDSTEGAFIGAFARTRLRARRVTVFYVNDEYGAGLRDGVRDDLRAHGAVVLEEIGFDVGSDFGTLVAASLRREAPDVVVIAGRHVETARIAQETWRRAPAVRLVAGDGALVLPNLAELLGLAADSLYVVAFWTADVPDSVSRAFVQRFRRVVGRDPQSIQAMSHDALLLLATAVREAGPSRARIRAYLASLGRSRPPYRGVTGPISFTSERPTRLIMVRLRGGVPMRVAQP